MQNTQYAPIKKQRFPNIPTNSKATLINFTGVDCDITFRFPKHLRKHRQYHFRLASGDIPILAISKKNDTDINRHPYYQHGLRNADIEMYNGLLRYI